MDKIEKKLQCFLSLKRHLNDDDIKSISQNSNNSIFTILTKKIKTQRKKSNSINDSKPPNEDHSKFSSKILNHNQIELNENDNDNDNNKNQKEHTSISKQSKLSELVQNNNYNKINIIELTGFIKKIPSNENQLLKLVQREKENKGIEKENNCAKGNETENDDDDADANSKSPEIINDDIGDKSPSIHNDDENVEIGSNNNTTPIISEKDKNDIHNKNIISPKWNSEEYNSKSKSDIVRVSVNKKIRDDENAKHFQGGIKVKIPLIDDDKEKDDNTNINNTNTNNNKKELALIHHSKIEKKNIQNIREINQNNLKKSLLKLIAPNKNNNSNNSKNNINNNNNNNLKQTTQLQSPKSLNTQKNQEQSLILPQPEIKKKEFELACISQLDNLVAKLKEKYKPIPNSTTAKQFIEIQKIVLNKTEDDKIKRIKQISQRVTIILEHLCVLLEDDKKRDLYLFNLIQILEVINDFFHGTKVHMKNESSTTNSFYKYKQVNKFVYSLFKIKSYDEKKLKEILSIEQEEQKKNQLLQFAKCYNGYINSTAKLKDIIASKIKGNDEKKYEHVLDFLKIEPHSVKYSKCFKHSRKLLDFVLQI